MLVFMYSEARQNFAGILDRSKEDGAVIIKRQDGSVFRLTPEPAQTSPFANIIPLSKKLCAGELEAALIAAKERI